MTLAGYRSFGGKHSETAALKNVLAFLGVRAPHTGEPFTEAMLLGIGGGIGGGYWVFEYKSYPVPLFSLFTRHAWWETGSGFLTALCRRLEIPTVVKETGSPAVADRHLQEALSSGKTAITWVDLACTPCHNLPGDLKGLAPHVVAVCGLDDARTVEVDDRAAVPYTVPIEDFAEARRAVAANKNRLLLPEAPRTEIDLARAVDQGIRACYEGLTAPPPELPAWAAKNSGHSAFEKWSRLIADTKDKKGWPRLFTRGRRLYLGLAGIFRHVELEGTGGGAFRPMYADFLQEAGEALAKPALTDVAGQYRELGQMWTAFANAALPDSIAPLKRARALMVERYQLFMQQGANSRAEFRQLSDRLHAVEYEMDEAFPLDEEAALALLRTLGDRLRQIHKAERQAAESLRNAIGAGAPCPREGTGRG